MVQAQTSVQLIRNATLKIKYADKTILLDPMLGEKATAISALGVNLNPRVHLTMPIKEILKDVDFVLLTHTHVDHYDEAAKRLISKQMKWYVQPADFDSVAVKDHFTNTSIIKDSMKVGNITIIRIQGSHGKGKLAEMMGASSGYVLKAAHQPTLYIMGDCMWDADTKRAVETYKPEYIVVNSGGAILPPLSKQFGPIILNEYDVMDMLRDTSYGARLIAVHMDAVDHCQTTRSVLRSEAHHQKVDMKRLLIPEDGERVVLKSKSMK